MCMYIDKVIEKCAEDYQATKVIIVHAKDRRMEVRVKPVGVLGLHLWKTTVLEYIRAELGNALVQQILTAVASLRSSVHSAGSLTDLEVAITSFYHCDPAEYLGPVAVPFDPDHPEPPFAKSIFESDLELPILEATRSFYRADSAAQITQPDITAYVRYAEHRLSEEISMAHRLLPPSSASKLVAAVEAELIVAHTLRLQQEFTGLLASERHKEIKTVYDLLRRLPDGIDPLVECFESFVSHRAHQTVEDVLQNFYKSDPSSLAALCADYVLRLAAVKHTFAQQIRDDFGGDERFSSRLESALRRALSMRPSGMPVEAGAILADFLDMALTNELAFVAGMPEEQFDRHIEQCLELLALLGDREPFIRRHFENFARRLLFRLSEHGACETALVGKLGV